MSPLTKTLIVLSMVISVASAAVVASLHAQRVDWHDKFVKEVNQHYYTIQVMRAETEAREIQVRNLEKVAEVREAEIVRLRADLNAKHSDIERLAGQLADLSGKMTQTLEHAEALNRNLSQLIAMQTELQNRADEMRRQRDEAVVERQEAQTRLFDLQGRHETAMRDLDSAETRYLEAARKLAQGGGLK